MKMYPSKVASFDNSLFPKYVLIAKLLQVQTWSVQELWQKCSHEFTDVIEFDQTLTDLYALNRIELRDEELVWNVTKNQLQ